MSTTKSEPGTPSAPNAPGPRGRTILGVFPEFRADPLAYLVDAANRHGDVVRLQLATVTAHLLRGPEQVKHVLQDANHNYGRATRGFDALKETLGDSLLTTDGEFWRRQRRIAQPAFHKARIAAFATLMAESAEEMVAGWKARASATGGVLALDLMDELLAVTLRILGRSMFGLDLGGDAQAIGGALVEVLEHTIATSQTLFHLPHFVPTPSNRRFNEALRTLDRVVYDMIEERRRTGAVHHDLLGMLMEARDEETGEGMDEKQLRDEVMTMLLAGHETTAMSLLWTFQLLSLHPSVRRRLEAEVRGALSGRTPTLEDLPKLGYARQVVDETLRLYPPAWVVGRSVTEDDVVGGYAVPAGSIVFVAPYVTHRDPSLWENPEGFDPDRFAPGGEAHREGRPRYAYFPFGGGPHLCIGNAFALMEAQLVLATVVQRARIDLQPGHRVEVEPLVTLRPKHGVKVKVTLVDAAPPAASTPTETAKAARG